MLRKAVAYARVSSKEQEKEGFSIPAQQKLLREYAKKHNIEIVREFADAETAKAIGRENFGEMVNYLRRARDVKTIIVEKTDRLYRNFRDYVMIDDEELEIHLVKEGEILSRDSKSHQKFIHGIKVLMAKNYIDNLSEEVKKGLYEKAANGQYPGQAPTGYINDREKRIMTIDPDRAPMVKQLFELYATREHSLDSLHAWARKNGLWSKHSKTLSRAHIERILKNPVYYGNFFYSGKLYRGTHTPIVTKELWDSVQLAFSRRNNTHFRRSGDFAFTGLLTCGDCGCSLVAEMKKGKYIYYHCTKAKKECSQRKIYVREEMLDEQFYEIIGSIQIPADKIDTIIRSLKDSCSEKNRFRDEAIASIRKAGDVLRARIDQAYLDKLDGKITEEFWKENTNRWQSELATCDYQLTAYSNADMPYYENGKRILELAQNAQLLYLRATPEEKRRLIKLALSNLRLHGVTIGYEMRNPFHNFVKWVSRPAWRRGWDSNPRSSFRRTTVFETVPIDHSGTSPFSNELICCCVRIPRCRVGFSLT